VEVGQTFSHSVSKEVDLVNTGSVGRSSSSGENDDAVFDGEAVKGQALCIRQKRFDRHGATLPDVPAPVNLSLWQAGFTQSADDPKIPEKLQSPQ